MSDARIGNFVLRDRIGQGGMGTVWRAVHAPTNTVVALKTLSRSYAADPRNARALGREARLVARLQHPSIVQPLDCGIISAEASEFDPDLLHAGSPWFAMEFISGGSLDMHLLHWQRLREVVRPLLGALAHAHARRVLHRDLKPSNILIAGGGDGRGLPVLTDFGIGCALDEPGGWEAAGSPAYMAPEHLRPDLGPQGPWTDLWSLGAIVWSVVTRAPPFEACDFESAWQRASADPPAFRPRIEVPRGLEAWLRRALFADPAARYGTAAGAAAAFEAMADGPLLPPPDRVVVQPRPPAADDTVPALFDCPPGVAPAPRAQILAFPSGSMPWIDRPRGCPVATGTGLLAHRGHAPVGRVQERDRLWRELREVATTRRPRALVITGERGLGKTHLARWLGEVAVEAGVAHVMAPAVTEVDSDLVPTLVAIAARDPLLLILENIDWTERSDAAVRALLRTQPCAALVVCTETRLPTGVMGAMPELELLPMAFSEVGRLLDALLPLEPALRFELCERAGGSPSLAINLLTEAAERGQLEPGPAGFSRRKDASELPGDLVSAWLARVEATLPSVGPDADGVVGLVAALAPVFSAETFAEGCAIMGLLYATEALSCLEAMGLLERDGKTLRVTEQAVREALTTHALRSGQAATAHSACVTLLRRKPPAHDGPARLARHLDAAGQGSEALDLALLAAEDALGRADPLGSAEAVALASAIAERLGRHPPARQAALLLAKGRVAFGRGEFQVAEEHFQQSHVLARRAGDPLLRARALRYQAMIVARRDLAAGEALFMQAQSLAEAAGAPAEVISCIEQYGTIARRAGFLDIAERSHREALARAAALPDEARMADALKELGGTLAMSGQTAEGIRCTDEALALYARIGSTAGLIHALNNRGDLAQRCGDRASAKEYFQRALAVPQAAESQASLIPTLNLGLQAAAEGEDLDALSKLTDVTWVAFRARRPDAELWARVGLLEVLARLGDWNRWDAEMTAAERLSSTLGSADSDRADLTDNAARLADAASFPERAARARALAAEERGRLNNQGGS